MKKNKVLLIFLRMTWSIYPPTFLLLVLGGILTTANAVFNIYVINILVHSITLSKSFNELLVLIFTIIAIKLALTQLKRIVDQKQIVNTEFTNNLFMLEFSKKVSSIDYDNLENAEVLDLKERAMFAVQNFGALARLFGVVVDFLSSFFTLITVTSIMIAFNVWYFIIVLALALVAVFLSSKVITYFRKVSERLIPINRRYNYYFETSVDERFQKDYRIYSMSNMITDKIDNYNEKTMNELKKIYATQANSNSLQAFLSYLTKLITYGYATLRVLTSKFGAIISIGNFTVIVNASEKFSEAFRSTLTSFFELYNILGHIEPFAQFMSIPNSIEKSGDKKLDSFDNLEFRDVVFCYPNSDKVILNHVSFKILKGEKISIVGLNNAGKSTIVKLICRLFSPSTGTILVNGININEYDYYSYLDMIAAVFQDYKLFPFTIKENIDPLGLTSSDEEINSVIKEVGLEADIGNLPKGIHTYLDKILHNDGTDMSGGQKQKIAIARALLKNSGLVILDEPTAALDPLAESEIYEKFNELVSNKTAIYISHRMSSSVFCDKILLLQDGEIKAYDSHQNLMKSNNLYKELFEAQAKNYAI